MVAPAASAVSPALLALLRCPYCGGRFDDGGRARDVAPLAVLACACCAYPVIDGIPILRLGDEVSAAIRAAERGDADTARRAVLDLPPARHHDFDAVRHGDVRTFAEAVRRVLPDGEGDYYALRFGDPSFVAADAVVRAIARRVPEDTGPLLDVCGGCGHLTWTLSQLARERRWPAPVLVDGSFWRLWLARRFLVPEAGVVCADANAPLPLASGSATLAVCNDAVHYVWGKRLLAAEMMRVAGPKGWVAWTHVHSALGDNATAGNTLAPAGYAALFDERRVLAARDEALVEAAVAGHALPWSGVAAAALEGAPALALVAAPHGGDLMLPAQPPPTGHGSVVRNPLYAETRDDDRIAWDLVLPSPEYEAEFGAVRAYAPAHLDWDAGDVADLARLARARPDLLLRRVLLQVPPDYL